jgi:serine protease Do
MHKHGASRIIFLTAGLLLLLSLACGITRVEGPAPTPEEAVTVFEESPPPEPTPEPPPAEPSLAVSTLNDLKQAVVQIVAEGSFVDPEVGLQLNIAGAGSGFIIDEQGIAVTNNHVVTGAALLRVYVAGESRPVNARVLGVSECSDLAVIDLDGDGYRYLEWYPDAISTGLEVYAAGFPLGDPEFTLTRGIISKEDADGESWWASVDRVLMHDAIINPGNSGGPLVTADSQVVGVNYSVRAGNQYLAIARDEALKILDRLRDGQDIDSIGVNGMAVSDGESLSGIWVSSVKSGSPADRAGVRGGDIITRLEGLVLATDDTMADYCDVLRSHTPERYAQPRGAPLRDPGGSRGTAERQRPDGGFLLRQSAGGAGRRGLCRRGRSRLHGLHRGHRRHRRPDHGDSRGLGC